MINKSVFMVEIENLQPSQLYVHEDKLSKVLSTFDPNNLKPVPIIKMEHLLVMTDGHHAVLAAYLNGKKQVPVYWDEDDLNLQAYSVCVKWCLDEGIHSVANLAHRVLSEDNYHILWLKRCYDLHKKLSQEQN